MTTTKIIAVVSAVTLGCALAVPVHAEDIPATPMNHSGFSMPTSASAAMAPPPPSAPAEPPVPEKPAKKKKMSKKKMMKGDMAGGAPAASDGKM